MTGGYTMADKENTADRRIFSLADFNTLSQSNKDLPTTDVDVPEWAEALGLPQLFVRIRMLTGAERDKFETSLNTKTGNTLNVRARLVGLCAVDDKGARLFADDKAIAELGKRSAAALDRLFDACRDFNKLREDSTTKRAEELAESPN